MADEEKTTEVSGDVVVSENEKGNPYHSKETGRFVSKGEEGTAAPDTSPAGLTKEERAKRLFSSGEETKEERAKRLFSISSDKEKLAVNELDRLLEQKRAWDNAVTLRNFKQARKDAIKYLHKEFSEEQNSILKETWKKVLDNCIIGVRIADKGLFNIICEDGHLQNQFEAKRSGGAYSPSTRYELSVTVWGFDRDYVKDIYSSEEQSKLYKLEKYGCLAEKDPAKVLTSTGRASQYGDYYIQFKDNIKNRTTYTMGDTLDDGACFRNIIPDSINNIDEFVFESYSRDRIAKNINSDLKNVNTLKEFKDKLGVGDYTEVQIHGNSPTKKDIAAIYMAADKLKDDEIRQVVNEADKSGIEVWLTRYDGRVEKFDRKKLTW